MGNLGNIIFKCINYVIKVGGKWIKFVVIVVINF